MQKTWWLFLVVLGWNMAAGPSLGAPASQPAEPIKVKGKVTITGSEEARITSATLTAADGTVYRLTMDAAGEDLARVMFGQDVRILGTVTDRQGQKWLSVTGFAEEKDTAAHELWRRSRCNACAAQKGAQHSAEPKDLRGAVAVTGRLYPYKERFCSSTRDARNLWLATDGLIQQIDLAARTQVKTYDRAAGLSDQPILEIASDGKTLWILSRGSAAALPIGQDKATPLTVPPFAFARLHVDGAGTWLIADSGTYRFTAPDKPPQVLPALPTGKRMAAEINKGMWLPFWKQNTAFYITAPATLGERLYVGSFGDVYELADGKWTKAIEGGVEQQARNGRLWALTSAGLVEYDPKTKAAKTHVPTEIGDGRPSGLLTTDTEVWVAFEPVQKGDQSTGGGVARLDAATGKWQSWKTIDGLDAGHALLQAGQDGAVWVATHQGKYQTLAAHPGMTYVTKTLFAATGFGLHRWDAAKSAWQTTPLAYANFEKRFICGQDGQGADDQIGPQTIDALCVGPDRIFATAKLVPVGNFSGYWPCVEQVARHGPDGTWTAKFEHHPEQLDLQGEQPLVLNISNKGEMFLDAVGHDEVLDLFLRDDRSWAVTEGCVGWFDPAKGAWQKVAEAGLRFYWRPTAVLDEGDEVFIGSDRGFVSRLDLKTGRCQILGGLKDRKITRLARQDGRLLIRGEQAPLGFLPANMPGKPTLLDADAAIWDGKTLAGAPAAELSSATQPAWKFKPTSGDLGRGQPFQREQMIGNMLWGPGAGGTLTPKYYVKEIYAPQFLCFGQDGKRLWLSTFTGLLRVDLPDGVKTK